MESLFWINSYQISQTYTLYVLFDIHLGPLAFILWYHAKVYKYQWMLIISIQ